jgi:hypothetical protein
MIDLYGYTLGTGQLVQNRSLALVRQILNSRAGSLRTRRL